MYGIKYVSCYLKLRYLISVQYIVHVFIFLHEIGIPDLTTLLHSPLQNVVIYPEFLITKPYKVLFYIWMRLTIT